MHRTSSKQSAHESIPTPSLWRIKRRVYTIQEKCHRVLLSEVISWRVLLHTAKADSISETRIERHLMRQRGAGYPCFVYALSSLYTDPASVREITADFGFSFAIPTSIAEQIAPAQPTIEPPSKRRRVSKEEDDGHAKLIHLREEAVKGRKQTASAQQNPKSPSRDQKDEPVTASTALEPCKKPQRASRKLLETEPDGKSISNAPAEELAPTSDSSNIKAARKPRIAEKKQAPIKAAEDTFIFGLKSRKRAGDRGEPVSTKPEVVSEDVSASPPKTVPAKAKGRKPEAPESQSVNAPGERKETAARKTEAKKSRDTTKKTKKPTRDLEVKTDVVEHAMSESAVQSKRPRRKAAVSATEKVTLGYEADLVPTDKLRRAPEADSKPARRKKAAVQDSSLAALALLPEVHEDVISPRVDESLEKGTSQPPKRRNRKAASQPNGLSSRARKTDPHTTTSEPQEDEVLQQPTTSVSEATATNSDIVKEPVRSKTTRRATKGRGALTETDVNIVRRSRPQEELCKRIQNTLSTSTKGSVCPDMVPAHTSELHATTRPSKARPTKDATRVRDQPRNNTGVSKSRGKPQAEPNPDPTPRETPCALKSPTARKRHVVASDEDLDWLFEKPQHPKPAVSRQPSSKVRRRRDEGNSVKDMDLDDLLDSIAGFSGKVLTSRRQRVVQS